MPSVRTQLMAIVVGCLVPAGIGAVLKAQSAEQEMLRDAREEVAAAEARVEDDLTDTLSGARLALDLVAQSSWLQRGMAEGRAEPVERSVERLAKAYKYRIVLAVDAQGRVLAQGNRDRGALAAPDLSAAADLRVVLGGKPLAGAVHVQLQEGHLYAVAAGVPVQHEGKVVGGLFVLSPLRERYLEHLRNKLSADLALAVDGKPLIATASHPAPQLVEPDSDVHFESLGKRLFAVRTFSPKSLVRPGSLIQLTASREVTSLRDRIDTQLAQNLAVLGGAAVLALGVALWLARRLGRSVATLADAAAQVRAGKYQTVPKLQGGQELEQLGARFNEMVEGLQERDRLRDTFGRYVTRQVADHLMKNTQSLGGELVPVTVLFSDIRSFTSISEQMEPRALLDFLNEYFSGMVESVLTHHGVVDKFIGDAIMAVFGAPVPEPDDPLHAVKAALEMRARLERINADFARRGLPQIRTGIGLHSGQVVAGNMGHAERMEYTVIGDAVNLASRLEGMTKELGCDVLMSEDLYRQVADAVDAEPLQRITVKGRAQDVLVYRLIGLK